MALGMRELRVAGPLEPHRRMMTLGTAGPLAQELHRQITGPGGGGGIGEAPENGRLFARRNAGWVEATAGQILVVPPVAGGLGNDVQTALMFHDSELGVRVGTVGPQTITDDTATGATATFTVNKRGAGEYALRLNGVAPGRGTLVIENGNLYFTTLPADVHFANNHGLYQTGTGAPLQLRSGSQPVIADVLGGSTREIVDTVSFNVLGDARYVQLPRGRRVRGSTVAIILLLLANLATVAWRGGLVDQFTAAAAAPAAPGSPGSSPGLGGADPVLASGLGGMHAKW